MIEKDCLELKDPKVLENGCKKADERAISKIIKCMSCLFFNEFKSIYNGRIIASTIQTKDDQYNTAFNDGCMKFCEHLKLNAWEHRGGNEDHAVRNALFTFCDNQLRAFQKKLISNNRRNTSVDPDIILEEKGNQIASESVSRVSALEEKEMRMKRQAIFQKAFSKLSPQCRDFIVWRKLKEITDEDLKKKYPEVEFKDRDPDDIVHRCMMKLKKLVDELKNEN